MPEYYVEHHLSDTAFDNKDFYSVIFIITLVVSILFFYNKVSLENTKQVMSPYYIEKFDKVPSLKERFANTKYDTAISKLLLEDSVRSLKYKMQDLNSSLNYFQKDLLKQQAMNDLILMLSQIKKGDLSNFDVAKMQQAVLEAGYGNVDSKLLEKAVNDYQAKVKQEIALQEKLLQEKIKTQEKIKRDSKDATVLARNLAQEIAEDEIQNFISNLSIIARVGSFVVQKVNEE